MKASQTALTFAMLTLFAVSATASEKSLLRDFDAGLGEWESSFLYSHVSGDERVEANGEGQLRMFVPPGGDHVRYVPTVDGVVRYSVNEDGRPIQVSIDVLEHTTGVGSVYLLLRFNDQPEFGKAYFFGLGNEGLPIFFKSGTKNGNNGVSMFWDYRDEPSLPDENIRLVLTMTAAGPNVVFNTRILDLSNGGSVLFDRTHVDRPGADDMLPVPWGDPAAPPEPYFGNHDTRVLLDTSGDTSGQAAEVILDNFCVIKHDAPLVSAESAVRVSFPATDRAFDLLAAQSVDGPWEVADHPSFEDNGFLHFVVPASSYRAAEFFELRER